MFHLRRTAFSSGLKSKVGLTLAKEAALRININLDGAPIASKSHTHPSHSQTSRLLTSSLSLGVPVPTQCVRANPTVMVIQQWSKQSFHRHHPGGVSTPPLEFFFFLQIYWENAEF
jgi:hypothetical protein